MQKELFDWQVVQDQIDINKGDRLNWKKILGMSLNKACAKFKAANCTAEQTYNLLVMNNPQWNDEIKRRLKIGVCARFGEMKISQGEMKWED